jgi:uncharacterized repeat protein (TIGR04052 family)
MPDACSGGSNDTVSGKQRLASGTMLQVKQHVQAGLWSMLLSACTAPIAPVFVEFRAQVQGQPFACTRSYDDLGSTHSQVSFQDLRMYVSHVRLVRADGGEEPLALVPDAQFQAADTALLDFENHSGACENGTDATHTRLVGRAPQADYRGLAFELGVPLARNHADPAQARPPLDVSSMFWVWRDGYKFMRLDARVHQGERARPFSLHLGSVGCASESPVHAPKQCTEPNRVQVRLANFAVQHDAVILELAQLFAAQKLTGEGASDGCESNRADADCGPVFAALGLARGSKQQLFRAARVR